MIGRRPIAIVRGNDVALPSVDRAAREIHVEDDDREVAPRCFERDGQSRDPPTEDEHIRGGRHLTERRLAGEGIMCAISLPGGACSRARDR